MNEYQEQAEGLTYLGKIVNEPVSKVELVFLEAGEQEGYTVVELRCTDFTSLCPITKQPDFGEIIISYFPNRSLIETKSLKLYLWKFREIGVFNEKLVIEICRDLFTQLSPHWLRVEGKFHARGGIAVSASHEIEMKDEGFQLRF